MREIESGATAVRALIDSGRYAEAQRSAERLAQTTRDIVGNQPSDAVATALELVAESRERNGDVTPVTLRQAAMAVEWRRLGGDPERLGRSLHAMGRVLLTAGRAPEAVTAIEEGVSKLRSSGASPARLAAALESLASGLIDLFEHDRALRAIDEAITVRRPAGAAATLGALELRSLALIRAGRYRDARPPVVTALGIRVSRPEHPDAAFTHFVHGDLLWSEGEPAAASAAYGKCLEIAGRLLRPDHPLVAQCTTRQGLMRLSLGDPTGAAQFFERAVAVAERSLGPDHPLFAGYLNDLAEAYRALMDFRRARSFYERALELSERQVGRDHLELATIVFNLALVSGDLGDLPEARRQFERAIAIWRDRLGGNHPFVALAMSSLAQVLVQHGQTDEAIALLQEVLSLRQRNLGVRHRDTAETLGDLSTVLLARGDVATAARLSERALGIWRDLGESDTPAYAAALTKRANIFAAEKRLAEARSYYGRALRITERVYGADHPLTVDLRLRVADLLVKSNPVAALRRALAAEEASRMFLLATLRYLPEREALRFSTRRATGLNLAMSVLNAHPRLEPANLLAVADAMVKSRVLVFDEVAARRQTVGVEPSLAESYDAWTSARQRLANLTVGTARNAAPLQFSLLQETRREAERAERSLAEQSAAFRTTRSQARIGLEEVRRALPPQSALLSFVRFEWFDGPRTVAPSAAYLAIVTRPGPGAPTVLSLGSASDIEKAISVWRQQLLEDAARTRSTRGGADGSRDAGIRLRRLVWDPLEASLKGVTRAFVVPDGALHLVNLSALPVGSSQYLIEAGPLLHYVTAERDIVQFQEPRPDSAYGLLALGGVAFDRTAPPPTPNAGAQPGSVTRDAACGSFASLRFEPLPETLGEADEVAARWRGTSGLPQSGVRVLSGSAATEGAFKRAAPGHRVLHLATHGFFLGGECPTLVGGTRAVSGLTLAEGADATAAVEDPLLLTGLALAGANARTSAASDGEDGILTADEVAALNLRGVEWAVLSACDTGLGTLQDGEGVFGLRRAFQVAGVRSVIMSLWSVEDSATRQWMRHLYDGRLRQKTATAEAVRNASLNMLQQRRAQGQSVNPFYWGAFVVAGDWQ